MPLQPPPEGWQAALLDSLVLRMQQYAGPQGYAVLKARTKKFKKTKVDRRAWIRCDRGGKPEKNSKSKGKRITNSRLIDYPFLIIAARPTKSDL